MRRCATALLNFQQLLCGQSLVRSDTSALQEMVFAIRAKHPAVPLPIPLAASLGHSYLLRGEPRRTASLLASHPFSHDLLQQIMQLLSKCPKVDIDVLFQFENILRSVSTVMSCDVLCMLADKVKETEKTEVVWKLLIREIREFPHLSGKLFGALCDLSVPTSPHHRQGVMDAFNIALNKSFISPRDYSKLLPLLSKGSEHGKALKLWSWLRHTSVRWDCPAVSAVIISASKLRRMNVAISAIRSLAKSNQDPTIVAQARFIRYLAHCTPPLTRYAEQLVDHWHTPQSLWLTEARVVGVELLFVHYNSKNFGRLRSCLVTADSCIVEFAELSSPYSVPRDRLRQQLLQVAGMPYILRHFAPDIEKEAWLRNFYDSGVVMDDLEKYPLVIAILATLSRHLRDEERFMGILRGTKVTQKVFETISTFVAEDVFFKNAEETLKFISGMAEALAQEVPGDVASWLELLGHR
ncbi:hypothetical protein ERJ75_000783700 [Trypanosoma vivax]|uniref:Mitochondrial RNA binding protein n=1 Tax=Trypanosoma vivax (strain Y486) TaxID=1055687 RepID=G0TWE2_TRYVY|nr:hypothetical protein TRVL_02768 [Trypanosoma vivax]KAH8613500.1 hypothetical protein ERJ75_000783700 [Trypanosoma vivax]CCC48280.1 conserved hypothetical protein [Trypanosoma vivax Y486]